MSDSDERQFKQRFQSEADALLFNDLHFDERLQQRVWENIRRMNAEPETADVLPVRNKNKSGPAKRQWPKFNLKVWRFGWYGTAAAMFMVLLISSILWLPDGQDKAPPDEPMMLDTMGQIEVFPVPESTNHDPESGPSLLSTSDPVILSSMEEAKAMLGEAWKAPSYIVEAFELDTIEAYRDANQEVETIVLTYRNAQSQSYSVSISRDGTVLVDGAIDDEEIDKILQSVK